MSEVDKNVKEAKVEENVIIKTAFGYTNNDQQILYKSLTTRNAQSSQFEGVLSIHVSKD